MASALRLARDAVTAREANIFLAVQNLADQIGSALDHIDLSKVAALMQRENSLVTHAWLPRFVLPVLVWEERFSRWRENPINRVGWKEFVRLVEATGGFKNLADRIERDTDGPEPRAKQVRIDHFILSEHMEENSNRGTVLFLSSEENSGDSGNFAHRWPLVNLADVSNDDALPASQPASCVRRWASRLMQRCG